MRRLPLFARICLTLAFASAARGWAGTVPDFGTANGFKVSVDGTRVVFDITHQSDNGSDLYSVPTGGGSPVLIGQNLIDLGIDGGQHYLISPDGTRVVFTSGSLSLANIWTVPIDGPLGAGVTLTPDGDAPLGGFEITPDSARVVYRKSTGPSFPNIELFSVPIAGGSSQKLSPAGTDVLVGLTISPDSSRVAFIDAGATGVKELYSAPVDGSAASVKLNTPFPPGGGMAPNSDFHPPFAFSPDSSRLVYSADQTTNGVVEIYGVPAGGGVAPVKLNGAVPQFGGISRFSFTPDGTKVVYAQLVTPADLTKWQEQIFAVALTGGSSTLLSPPPPSSNFYRVTNDVITPDSSHVVFNLQSGIAGPENLFSVAIGGGSATLLNTPVPPTVAFGFLVPDSSHVLFQWDFPFGSGAEQLFVAPIAGGTAPVELSGPLAQGTNLSEALAVSGDGTKVVYLADQADERTGFDLFRAAVAGGPATRINPAPPAGGHINGQPVIIGDRVVYFIFFADSTEIWSLPLAGGSAVQLVGTSVPGPTPAPTTGPTPGPTPTNIPGNEDCGNCQDDDGDSLVDRDDPDCPARANGNGIGLEDPKGRGKALVACQKTLAKAGASFALGKAKILDGCLAKIVACVEQKPADTGCVPKAGAGCHKNIAKITSLEAKLTTAASKSCGAPLTVTDLTGADGLGYGSEATICAALQIPALASAADVVRCEMRRHACQVEQLVSQQTPRANELLTFAGIDTAPFSCLTSSASGMGQGVGDPKVRGKQITTCETGLQKAAAAFVKTRMALLHKCSDAVSACVQLKPHDATCVPKAQSLCAKIEAKLNDASASPNAKARSAIVKACAADLPDVLGDTGLDYQSTGAYCTAVGVATLGSADDVATCTLRQHTCRVGQLLDAENPRAREFLTLGGIVP